MAKTTTRFSWGDAGVTTAELDAVANKYDLVEYPTAYEMMSLVYFLDLKLEGVKHQLDKILDGASQMDELLEL